jgi:protein TonB
VVVPAPPLEPPEPAVRPSEIVRPPELPAALLDAGWEIPALGPPPPPGPQPFDAREMEAPVRLEAPLPAYTEPARRARREGDVVLEAVIDLEGRVREARVLQSLGFGLDEAALLALADWRFEPARKAGRPIPVIYRLVVRFRLS